MTYSPPSLLPPTYQHTAACHGLLSWWATNSGEGGWRWATLGIALGGAVCCCCAARRCFPVEAQPAPLYVFRLIHRPSVNPVLQRELCCWTSVPPPGKWCAAAAAAAAAAAGDAAALWCAWHPLWHKHLGGPAARAELTSTHGG